MNIIINKEVFGQLISEKSTKLKTQLKKISKKVNFWLYSGSLSEIEKLLLKNKLTKKKSALTLEKIMKKFDIDRKSVV